MSEGWIKAHRKMLDNPVVCKDGEHLAVWMYLLLNATHENKEVMFGGKKITLTPGQLLTSAREIGKALKFDHVKVHRILKFFEGKTKSETRFETPIETRTDRQKTLVVIKNWGVYQIENETRNETRFETQVKHELKAPPLSPKSRKEESFPHTPFKEEKNKITPLLPRKNKQEWEKCVSGTHAHTRETDLITLGTYRNVALTKEWLSAFKAKYGERYVQSIIDKLSVYKKGKGVENADDSVYLEQWAIEDAKKAKYSFSRTDEEWDEFWEAALKRSEENIQKRSKI